MVDPVLKNMAAKPAAAMFAGKIVVNKCVNVYAPAQNNKWKADLFIIIRSFFWYSFDDFPQIYPNPKPANKRPNQIPAHQAKNALIMNRILTNIIALVITILVIKIR